MLGSAAQTNVEVTEGLKAQQSQERLAKHGTAKAPINTHITGLGLTEENLIGKCYLWLFINNQK